MPNKPFNFWNVPLFFKLENSYLVGIRCGGQLHNLLHFWEMAVNMVLWEPLGWFNYNIYPHAYSMKGYRNHTVCPSLHLCVRLFVILSLYLAIPLFLYASVPPSFCFCVCPPVLPLDNNKSVILCPVKYIFPGPT